jgi:hypothetical protein
MKMSVFWDAALRSLIASMRREKTVIFKIRNAVLDIKNNSLQVKLHAFKHHPMVMSGQQYKSL